MHLVNFNYVLRKVLIVHGHTDEDRKRVQTLEQNLKSSVPTFQISASSLCRIIQMTMLKINLSSSPVEPTMWWQSSTAQRLRSIHSIQYKAS